MSPWRHAAITDVPPAAGALAAAVGIATNNLVLVIIWVAFVMLDFFSAGVRVFLDDAQDWRGGVAVQGMAKKAAYFSFALVAGLLDIAAGQLVSGAVADLGLLTKATLALLIGVESGSVLRNLQAATGEWRIVQMLMRARDVLKDPDKARHGDRWYDHAEPPPPPPSSPEEPKP